MLDGVLPANQTRTRAKEEAAGAGAEALGIQEIQDWPRGGLRPCPQGNSFTQRRTSAKEMGTKRMNDIREGQRHPGSQCHGLHHGGLSVGLQCSLAWETCA